VLRQHCQAFRRAVAAHALALVLCCTALAGEMPVPPAAGGTGYEAAGDMQNPAAGHIEIGAAVEMGDDVAGDMDNRVVPAGAVLTLLRIVLVLP